MKTIDNTTDKVDWAYEFWNADLDVIEKGVPNISKLPIKLRPGQVPIQGSVLLKKASYIETTTISERIAHNIYHAWLFLFKAR